MVRSLSLALVSSVALSSAAMACPSSNFQVGNVQISPDGMVSRVVYVLQAPDSQNAKNGKQYVPMVRDRVKLEAGDELTLNSNPGAMDVLLQVQVREKSQERDAKGIFSTTYFVTETHTPTFGGMVQKSISKSSVVTVKSNYVGNGTYSKDCGSIEQIEVETGSNSAAN